MMEMTTYHLIQGKVPPSTQAGVTTTAGGFAASTIYGGSGADYILLHTAELGTVDAAAGNYNYFVSGSGNDNLRLQHSGGIILIFRHILIQLSLTADLEMIP